MMRLFRKLCGASALVVAACQSNRPTDAALGHERADCRPDRSCDPGLICLSNLCVRPPGASCPDVGELLASLELGDRAEPETRAPVVARYKAQCDALLVTKDEQQCLDKARDKWAAARCVPRMFPDLGSSSSGDCAPIVGRMRAAMTRQAAYRSDPAMTTWFDRTLAVVQESCEHDAWPDALKKCLLASDGMAAITQTCQQQMPPALQQQLQDRMTRVMQDAVKPPAPAVPAEN
jgi:hypothetical protein